jgi:hypothetical protein
MQPLRAALAIVFITAVLEFVSVPAVADGACPSPPYPAGTTPSPSPSGSGTICVPAVDPGSPGDPGGGSGDGAGGSGDAGCPSAPDGDCVNESGGVWINPHGCYGYLAAPQPPANHPAWDGHTPSEGNIFICFASGSQPGTYIFVAGGQAPLPDPRVLAQQALDQLVLAVPEINIAPDPPLATYVGLETWLWVPEDQWDELSLTVTAGATSVTVTATPVRIDWNLTEGSTSCASAGRPWVRGMSSDAQTDCSFTFSTLSDGQPKGKYAVSATIAYSATWTCTGACLTNNGDLGEVPSLTSNDAIEVDERQSVVVQ